jgi:hypothetical protein
MGSALGDQRHLVPFPAHLIRVLLYSTVAAKLAHSSGGEHRTLDPFLVVVREEIVRQRFGSQVGLEIVCDEVLLVRIAISLLPLYTIRQK